MIFQAHKGVSTENPENTMPAFAAAVEQGYKIIELDVSVTRDMRFVVLHDSSINRTARLKNGEMLPQELDISELTYNEASAYDYGISFSKKFAGTSLPLLDDVLEFAKANDIKLKIDNKYQYFNAEQRSAFFELIRDYTSTACLTCSNVDELIAVSRLFAAMQLHYDGEVNESVLERIAEVIPKDRLTVWLPHKNPATSWVKVEFANKANAELVKRYARLGVWIISTPEQLSETETLGADVIETNGALKPPARRLLRADMHTHSENSHDSSCRLEDMHRIQSERGTSMFAVTDHLDNFLPSDDILEPIVNAHRTADAINARGKGARILAGVEIGEGAWNYERYLRAMHAAEHDVVIGSVHYVRPERIKSACDFKQAYSLIDFSKLDRESIDSFLDAYFDDILEMLEKLDFDILAHLTCPLRYINGKYHMNAELSKYDDKIDKILRIIISRGIALEVNTSAFDMMGEFMAPEYLLKRYRAMGGYLITIASDAHIAENAAKHFDEAERLLKKLGFECVFYYKSRRPYQITL